MKGRKLFKAVLAGVLCLLLALGVCACSAARPSDPNTGGGDAEIRGIYDLYVENCAGEGQTPLTYDAWLASIKGEKGDKGDPGTNGKDGNGWLYGDTAPASGLGKVGDLYLNYSTWDVYTKETGGWTLRGNIKGEKGDPGTGSEGGGGEDGDGTTAELQIHFLELGNGNAGDCTLLKTGDTEVLIDAGSKRPCAATLVPKIKEYCTDGIIEYVIVTHAHEDHIASFVGNNGTDGIFANFKCGTIIDFARKKTTSGIASDYITWRDKEVSQDGAVHYTALQCWNETDGAQRSYELAEGISFEILYQKYYETSADNDNNYSVCTLFTQGDYHYLFTGDLEKEGEESLAASNDLPHCKLYKGGHHGSKTSSNDCLLAEITPENVCICCCAGSSEYTDNNANQFPTQDTINRIAKYTKNIYVTTLSVDGTTKNFTSMNGDITVTSDGVDFSIHGSNNDTILMETDWFKQNRTWPADGVK